jgi:hypothetical protein
MKLREYARHRGCGLQAVQFALKAGRIPRDANGMINSEVADHAWLANTRKTMARPCPPRQADESTSPTEPIPGMTYAQARVLTQVYEAQRRKLVVEQMEGKLISRAEVEREATQVAAETDEATVRELLESELHRIFGDSAERELKSMPSRGEWRLPRR